MLTPVNEIPAEGDPRYAEAHQQVFNPLVTLMGQCAYALACGLVFLLYRNVAPPQPMAIWIYLTCAVFAVVIALDLAYVVRQPGAQETIRVWRRIDKKVPMAFDLIAIGVLLLLYPHGTESLKVLTVAYFVGYVPMQMISDPENAAGNRFSTVAVLGSFAATLIWNGDTTERYLAALMVIYGAVLFTASSVLRNVVISAVDAKLQSEKNARALEAALTGMSEERDAKTRFIAAASHDLGQPLQAAGLFFGQVMHAPTKRQREAAAQGVRQAFAAADQLLSHMLNHLSLKADAVMPQLSSARAGPVLKKLARQFTPAAKARGMEISVIHSSRKVVTDTDLLERALGNFISNAVIHSSGDRILIGLRSDGPGFVRFCVADNGTGVNFSDAAHIFDDYYRGAECIAGAKGGFGLGLASARRIAALLGGEAGMAPRKYRGALFYLRLPLNGPNS